MALIKCSECGKKFSDKAEKCPACGCPMSEQTAVPKAKKQLPKRIKDNIKISVIVLAIMAAIAGVMILIAWVNNSIVAQKNKEITDKSLYCNGGTKISEIADSFSSWADVATG